MNMEDFGNKGMKQCWPPCQDKPKDEECSSDNAQGRIETLPSLGQDLGKQEGG
jgi:hypothetical protein